MISLLLITHFVADFLMQSREMGKKKSSEWRWLLAHLLIQTNAFCWVLWPVVGAISALKFALVNSLIHGIIDWNIWRLYKLSVHARVKKGVNSFESLYVKEGDKPFTAEERRMHYEYDLASWQYWEDHVFYSTIGLDQLLHGLTLVILAGWIT